MNLKITSLFVFFTFFTAFGQETYNVSGKLIASESETPISFANAVLMHNDTVLKGSSSDTSGTFTITNVAKGTYKLKISFLGYTTYTKQLEISKNLDLGTIALQKDNESLDGVTITNKKPVLKREIDRLIFNIQGTALTEDNTWEVLRRTPGVIVINNTLSIKNSTPTVYINDRKVHLSASEIYQLLEGTPAETVKSVEVITNPPARYDAQGGTILNIVMTKNLIVGYHGSIYGNFTQGVFPRYSGGINQFYKRGKFNIFGNYNYRHSKINRDNDETINYLENTTTTSVWNSDINRNRWSNQHNFNLNVDYEFDDKNTLSFSGNLLYLPYWKRNTVTNSVIDNQTAANEDFSLTAINRANEDKHNLGLNLDYVHHFEREGAKLSANIHYTDYDKANDQHVATDYTVVSSTDFSTAFTTHSNQTTNILSGQVDYELPISETANFEAGAKVASIETNSNLWQFNIENGVSTLDVANSDTFLYDESIYAGYVSYAKNWEKWSLKVGFRGEQTEIKGNSLSTNQINTQNYFELFPTAYISHKVSDKLNVYIDFSRRIQRPSFDDLNPFRYNFTDFSFATGNPRLQPAIANNYKLGVEIADKFYIDAYYTYDKAAIYELTLQDNDNDVIQYISSNVENNVNYGLDFLTYFSVVDNWNVSVFTSIFNLEDTFTLDNVSVSQKKWSNYTSIDNNFTFLKDQSLTANLSFLYISSTIQGLSEVSNRSLVNLSLRKTLWNKKVTLSLSLNDIFNGQEFTNTTRYFNQNSFYRTNLDLQTIRIGFRYNFGNTKLQTNQRTKSSAEQERLKD
ncbi:outer membrane beta-barrel family protein [Kordia algicida OT-1]|uniref:Possible TonB-dependent receptor n=1 Tax=Kordia algicida OT-1 TaxID=391587 RepID=A9DRE6_9FLAO|nr:outer membrane beta-barrel family protein [Kordia algicida]EDP96782.1 possible TonB-dependent receptor [Kordia algicida OT-1]